MWSLAVHGGAGSLARGSLAPHREAAYLGGIEAALAAGSDILAAEGSSVDAVAAAVRVLESDPLFNAGRGAALTRAGTAELDASIMEGREQRAGAVAAVRHIAHPVDLARRVMDRSRHVLLVGEGAEEFALAEGFTLVPNRSLATEERLRDLALSLAGSEGTVGAVALDARGDLAAATSTGGMTAQHEGRVGDSPLIGAGTYARNGVAAVSATGDGECFIRAVAAHHVCLSVETRGLALDAAVQEALARIRGLGGRGGLIAVDAAGEVVMRFSTAAMFRGTRDASGRHELAIW